MVECFDSTGAYHYRDDAYESYQSGHIVNGAACGVESDFAVECPYDGASNHYDGCTLFVGFAEFQGVESDDIQSNYVSNIIAKCTFEIPCS